MYDNKHRKERFMRGFGPARRGSFGFAPLRSGQALLFRQKDPKSLAPGRGPSGVCAPVPVMRAAELASLKQSSPQIRICGTGAQPRPKAPALRSSSTFVIGDPGSLLFHVGFRPRTTRGWCCYVMGAATPEGTLNWRGDK